MGRQISKSLQLKVGKPKDRKTQYFIRVQHSPKFNDVFVSYSMGSHSSLATHKTTGDRYYIPNAIEYGHALPGQADGAKAVAPIPYLRPAFDSNIRRAERLMRLKLFDGIDRAYRGG
jgi:hypothetical protein